ncbi:hypothetical protein ACFWUP_08315 [Nocardia sp. NPDC058658]|uniref:hypothetical protein n=1 Tax=Nocardia sp. NPDC058658 TaxID=3346580 RepID=UPI00365A98DC
MAAEVRKILHGAGLELLEGLPKDSINLPDPRDAWVEMNLGSQVPDFVVDDDLDGFLNVVDERWYECATSAGVIDTCGRFLLCLTGWNHWRWVGLIAKPRIAHIAGEHIGEPEFVTISPSGMPFVGVTTEEDGIWIVSANSLEPRAALRDAQKARTIELVRDMNSQGSGFVEMVHILQSSGLKEGKFPIALLGLMHNAFGIPLETARTFIGLNFGAHLEPVRTVEEIDNSWRKLLTG